uniref:Uncharacterized protein n=1 Tax=Felis catus TaxID=9685 RepID=A0ABI8ASY4_FELCA
PSGGRTCQARRNADAAPWWPGEDLQERGCPSVGGGWGGAPGPDGGHRSCTHRGRGGLTRTSTGAGWGTRVRGWRGAGSRSRPGLAPPPQGLAPPAQGGRRGGRARASAPPTRPACEDPGAGPAGLPSALPGALPRGRRARARGGPGERRRPAREGPRPSPPVAVALEVEPELEDAVGELAAEAVAVGVLPLAVDDLEGDVLVGRPRVEAQRGEVLVVGAGLQEVLGRGALVDEVGVEDVELVALHDLGRRVVEVVVRLVVLVPLEARVHAVEEAGLARPVLVGPQVGLAGQRHLHAELRLVLAHALLGPPEEDVLRALARVPCGRGARQPPLPAATWSPTAGPPGRGHRRRVSPPLPPKTGGGQGGNLCVRAQGAPPPGARGHVSPARPSPVTCSCCRDSCRRCWSSSGSSTCASSGSSWAVSSRGLYLPAS